MTSPTGIPIAILPQHEQHFPDKLLPHRLEEYVDISGSCAPTTDRRAAQRVTGEQVLAAIAAAQSAWGKSTIDPRYFVGTCFHESGCTNEWDTEIATASSPGGFVSVGAFQIGEEEAKRYGYQLVDMLDLGKASDCMVRMAEDNKAAILAAVAASSHASTLDYTDFSEITWPDGGLRAYLAIAHNHGCGYARITIANYGLDWSRYKARNPLDRIVSNHYGEDCVTGGTAWPK